MTSNLLGIAGIAAIVLIAVIFSSNRRAIRLRVVAAAFALQALIAAHSGFIDAGLGCTLDRRPRLVRESDAIAAARATVHGGLAAQGLVFDAVTGTGVA